MSKPLASCFGFHLEGTAPCTWCTAARRCRAIRQTHGDDIVADLLTHLMEQLPDVEYEDKDRVKDIVRQLRNPKLDWSDKEAQEIGLRNLPGDEPDIDV